MSLKKQHSSKRNTAKIYSTLAGLLLPLQCVLVPSAHSVEVLSAHELASHCTRLSAEPEGADAQYCGRYIQGFVDGAIATDARVMLNAESALSGDETFTERAMRTRMPGRVDRSRAEKLAGFCLGEPLQLRELVDVVVADLMADLATTAKDEPAMEVVYKSLMKNYPCNP